MIRTLSTFALLLLALPAWAQEPQPAQEPPQRIGFVDLRRVLQECPQGKRVAAEIQKETEGYDKEVRRLQVEVDRLAAHVKAIPAGDPDAGKYKPQVDAARDALDRATTARQLALENLNVRLRPPCYKLIQETVAAVAAQYGLLAVLNRKPLPAPEQGMEIWNYELESQSVIFCEKGMDLTEAVLSELRTRAAGDIAAAGDAPPAKPVPPPQPGKMPPADRSGFGVPGPAPKAAPPSPEDADAARARLKAELKAEILAELGKAPAAGQPGPAPAAAPAEPAADASPVKGTGALEGIVMHHGEGAPGCQIKALQVIERSGFLGGTTMTEGKEFLATTGADGKYRFEHLPAGKYFLKWLPAGSPSWIRRAREEPDVEVQADQTTVAKQIDLGHSVIGD